MSEGRSEDELRRIREDNEAWEEDHTCHHTFKNGNGCRTHIIEGALWCERHVPLTGERRTLWKWGNSLQLMSERLGYLIGQLDLADADPEQLLHLGDHPRYQEAVGMLPEGTMVSLKTMQAKIHDIADTARAQALAPEAE